MPDVALPAAAPASWFARWRERALRTTPRDVAPVVLRHSRIYLLPTRRGWAVIGTLAMMLVGSLNYSLALGLGVTFVLAGLVAAAQLHAFRNLAGLQVAPLAAGEAFAGGTLPFTLAVHAGAAARHDITLASAGAAATGSVAAGTALTFTLAVPAPARGRLALDRPEDCALPDPAGAVDVEDPGGVGAGVGGSSQLERVSSTDEAVGLELGGHVGEARRRRHLGKRTSRPVDGRQGVR